VGEKVKGLKQFNIRFFYFISYINLLQHLWN
jgi:hypothetical protein